MSGFGWGKAAALNQVEHNKPDGAFYVIGHDGTRLGPFGTYVEAVRAGVERSGNQRFTVVRDRGEAKDSKDKAG